MNQLGFFVFEFAPKLFPMALGYSFLCIAYFLNFSSI